MTPTALYTPDEAADLLKVRPGWLTRKAGRREIPHVKVAGAIRFRPEDVEAIVAAGVRRPAAEGPAVSPMRRRTTTTPPPDAPAPVLRARPEAARRKPRTA